MVAHHSGGLHMAEFAAAEADNSQVRRLAEGVVDGQRGEIAELQGLGSTSDRRRSVDRRREQVSTR